MPAIRLKKPTTITTIGDHVILFSKRNGACFLLNETAIEMFQLGLNKEFFEVLSDLKDRWDIPFEDLCNDLKSVYKNLHRLKLVTYADKRGH